MVRFGWIAVVGLLIAGALGSDLRAESPPEAEQAKTLFDEGVDFARQGDWNAARSRFVASLELIERPSTLYNLGSALSHLDRYVEAAEAFERYLESTTEDPDADLRPSAERKLREALALIATLTLTIEPTNAKLIVDGTPHAGLGAKRTVHLEPGIHTIEGHLEGHDTERWQLELAAGERIERNMVLALLPPPIAQTRPPPSTPPVHSIVAPKVHTSPESPDEAHTWYESPILWIAAGVVIAGAIVGGVLLTRNTDAPYGGSTDDVIQALHGRP